MIEPSLFSGMLIQSAATNIIMATPLALFARWLQCSGRHSFLSHLLWLIVLIELVTPPVYALPVVTGQALANSPIVLASSARLSEAAAAELSWFPQLSDWKVAVVSVWLFGSAAVMTWSVRQALRFNRLLQQGSLPAGRALRDEARQIAAGLGLRRAPAILTTGASIPPMVWWVGGPIRIYLPRAMIQTLERDALRSVLAHELAHVRRRDYVVRWLECIACIVLWWNPLAWWARRNLRVCEEVCCDALVLSKCRVSRDVYAGALVSVMELLAMPTPRMASQMNGGVMERRINMILSKNPILETPRWLRAIVLVSAVIVLPLGLTHAQDDNDLTPVTEWIESGVNSGLVTQEQADIMLNALRTSRFGTLSVADRAGNVIRLHPQPTREVRDGLPPLSAENPKIVIRPDAE